MKKFLAMLLALVMLVCYAVAGDDITGNWYADFWGMPFSLTLNADGSYVMDIIGEIQPGAWVQEGEQLIFDQGTEAEMTMQYDATAESILLDMDGEELLFTREAPVTYTPAAVRADAALEDFAGSWSTVWINMFDMMIDPAMPGMSVYFTIDGVDVTLISDDGFTTDSIVLSGNFADGALTLVEPAEDEYSEETTYVITLLEDGMMACETEMMDESVAFYLEACDPSMIPAALPSGPVDHTQLLGVWYEENYTLTVNEDGTSSIVDSDGYAEDYNWVQTEEGGMLTGEGFFADSEFFLNADGTLNLAWWLDMSREPYVAPEPYDITLILGDWIEADGSVFTVSADYTAVYLACDGSEMTMEWENGAEPVITTGDWWLGTMTVNEEGVLVMDDGFTHKEFNRPAPSTEPVEQPASVDTPAAGGSAVSISDPSTYVEQNFICVKLTQGDTVFDLAYTPVSSVVFHENGMADVTIMGMLQENQPYMTGNMGGVDTLMVTYMGYLQLMYNVGETGLDLNYMDMMDMHFEIQ